MTIHHEGRQLRHEMKYSINPFQYNSLRHKLAKVLKADPHSGPNGFYHVRSLYFDDLRNTALFEKLAGVPRRKKYRIRVYNHSDKFIKLERKAKYDQYVSKDSVELSRDEADRMISGDIGFLSDTDNALLRDFYLQCRRNLLRPNVIVDYEREAYVHPVGNVRITFDKNLHTGLGSVSLFDANAFSMGITDYKIIMEIKFNDVIPLHIIGLFPTSIRPKSAIGKFVICKRYNKYNEWEDQ